MLCYQNGPWSKSVQLLHFAEEETEAFVGAVCLLYHADGQDNQPIAKTGLPGSIGNTPQPPGLTRLTRLSHLIQSLSSAENSVNHVIYSYQIHSGEGILVTKHDGFATGRYLVLCLI